MGKSILVVGNGSIGIDKSSNKAYINNRTGDFLLKLQERTYHTTYLEPITNFEFNNNLQNFNLDEAGLKYVGLLKSNRFKNVIEILKLIKSHDFIYIFLPGTLGTIIAILSIFLIKPYAIYLRGELKPNHLNRYILRKSKFLLTVSPYLKEKIYQFQNNAECIRPMVDINLNDFYSKKYTYHDKLKILYVGNISYGKGILELLEVARKFDNLYPNFTFQIVGGGALYSDLTTKSIGKNIKMTGQIANKSALLKEFRESDIFYFPSHTEGFPRVLFEAMSQSLPIFTTMVGGISGYMVPFENCIPIPENNALNQMEIITYNLKNEDLLNRIANNGHLMSKEVLTNWGSHEKLFEDFLEHNV